MTDTLANSLNSLKVSEMKGLQSVRLKPASKMLREVLLIFQRTGYVGEFEFVDDAKSGEFVVKLTGRINACGVVKPRFPVSAATWERFEQRYLPAKNVGFLVVSTSKGLMTHNEAKEKNVGGRLICFVY